MDKKRIAIIGLKGLPPFGGAANVGDNIIEHLAGQYDFTIYATESHTSHRGEYKGAHQIVFRRFPIKKLNVFYYYIASAFHAVFTRKYDLIHLHHMDGAFTLLLLRLKYKVIATGHGTPYENGKWSKMLYPYFKLNEWFQARLSNHLTICARYMFAQYTPLIPVSRISYIPNGVKAVPPAATDLGVSNYILFAAGRIISSKGLHILLSALHQSGYKGKLLVLGDYNQNKEYKKELLDLAAGLDVEFKGLIKDKSLLNAYVAGASLFIFPSTLEGMSMMLLEVATLRTPVIASDIVQNTDVFDPDEVLFFQSGSDTDLAAKLHWALDHPDEMKKRSAKAWQALMTKYQPADIANQYAVLFDKLTAKER
jgi:glycosyltransferase involved in cell wall biosynthesis